VPAGLLGGQADASMRQADPQDKGGTGLGLTICRRLVGLMNGRIWLEHTAPGQGSTFTFELPLKPAAQAQWHQDFNHLIQSDLFPSAGSASENNLDSANKRSTPSSPQEASTTELGRVLLVEDGPDNQRLIKHLLKKAGAEITLANDGVQALETIDSSHESFDLIITDIQMPNMDGYTLMAQLQANGNQVPVIALTAHAMPEDRDRCLQAGCCGFATKPINREELLGVCHQAIAEKQSPESIITNPAIPPHPARRKAG